MEERRVKITGIRKIIGEKLRESIVTFPQASGVAKYDATNMFLFQKEMFDKGIKATNTVIFAKIISEALKNYMQLNSRVEKGEIVYYDQVNIGIGTQTPKGLMVVVLKDLQNKSLSEISSEFGDIMTRVKTNKLSADDISGSTLTISNLSKVRIDSFTSIVNNDECIIMGFAEIKKEVIALDDKNMAIRDIGTAMINMNHVISDGMEAAMFLGSVAEMLEDPSVFLKSQIHSGKVIKP